MSNNENVPKQMYNPELSGGTGTETANFIYKDGNNFVFKDTNNFIFRKEIPK